MKKNAEIVVLSDLHLGTYGCHANEVLEYLKTINPSKLILNGDIIDIWNFKKSYFPKAHMQVVRQILKMAEKGTEIFYITGNHDEALRKYSGTKLGSIVIDDKLILEVDGKKIWIFHGDIFDRSTKGGAKFIAKLGGKGYDLLILLNLFINSILKFFGREKVSFSKRIKSSVKKAVKWINNFEDIASSLAIDQGFDVVICGHIHKPQMRTFTTVNGSVLYLNSGDWVEHCTSLEYANGEWTMFFQPEVIRQKHQLVEEEQIINLEASILNFKR